MAYSTLADLKKAIPERDLIQVTDDEDRGQVNEARVTQAIQDADDLIDSYLRGKHTVPLATVPPIVRRHSIGLSTYYLYSRRLGYEPTEAMTALYKEALRFLADVRDGKAYIDDPESIANTGGVFKVNKDACDREYTSTKWDTF
jgi:phage gp36-like protein